MVRGKFQLIEVRSHSYTPSAKTLVFSTVYDTSTPENARFTKATPSGRLEMTVDNPAALEAFELGKFYYADFTPAT